MECSTVMVACLGIVLSLGSFSVADKSHSVMLTRLEHIKVDSSWVQEYKAEFAKIDKNTKVFNAAFKLRKDVTGDNVTAEIKIYQQSGGKYVKAPIDFPRRPLCQFFEDNEVLWPCIQEHSNIPKKCPIYKDTYWIRDLNPNNCKYGSTMPPNLPENYKGEVYFWLGFKQLLKIVGYVKLKRNIRIA